MYMYMYLHITVLDWCCMESLSTAGFPDHRIVDAFLKPTVDESEETFSWVLPDLDLLREYP